MSTDEILLALHELKKGNMDAFESFYENTKRTTFFGAYAVLKDKMMCEDVLQEVYLKFLSMIKEIDESRSVVAFLATMARNMALNIYNKEKRNVELQEGHDDGYEEFKLNERKDFFERMRLLLNDEEYEIVILHVIDELKHREIADLLKIPLGSVTWKYNNAIQKLQKGMEDFL